jgi:chemotaxis signal transduction protein
MDGEQAFCLFDSDAGPMAVSVESVAAVLETESLVPLVWSPPQVVGLCPFHREVVPVIALVPNGNGPDADRESELDPRRPASAVTSAAKESGDDDTRCIVLILRTENDAWGLRIDHSGTFIGRECPDLHPPRVNENGAVFIGDLVRAETRYTILDAEATWRGLRSTIVRWYGLINEPRVYSAFPVGETTRQAGTGTAASIQSRETL